jgi:hypothetical protein
MKAHRFAARDELALTKPEATIKAAFALNGHTVHKGTDGGFYVSRFGLSRYCKDLEALQDFAKLVGVTHGV